ncbi:hypothetical protein AB0D38_10525, partial [Streptomyces sp. NPDC048279]|uniref:hypothetical protein n=1 Tax=Streptomyces sp. NPDC048279 TaxID=3154714 RepID=UPI003447635F
AAAAAFGVEAAFDNHAELIAHPGVDVVVVAVTRANRLTCGFVAATTRARPGCTAPAIFRTRGFADCQGLSSGTTTSPFRDHTPA